MKRRWRGRDRGLWGRERWRRIAKAKLQRDPLCAFCFAEGKVVAARVADHKTPHHNDLRLFWVPLDELQSLCLNCHNSRKRYEERHGFRRDVGPDGYPLDPRHPGFDHEGAASKGADLGAGDDPDEIEVDPNAGFEV